MVVKSKANEHANRRGDLAHVSRSVCGSLHGARQGHAIRIRQGLDVGLMAA